MWAIQENVPCVQEKNVYSAIVGWKIPCMSFRSSWCVDQGLCFLTELITYTFLMLKNYNKSGKA